MNRIDHRTSLWFPVTPSDLWDTIERFQEFESWWPWLRAFAADSTGLIDGNVLHGTVMPPVPYRLHLDVGLEHCDRPHHIDATVTGDVTGPTVLRLTPAGVGTQVDMSWSLTMRSAPLRLGAHVAYPLLRWGHDRVVILAANGFAHRALDATLKTAPRDCPPE